MIKKVLIGCAIFVVMYTILVQVQVFLSNRVKKTSGNEPASEEVKHRVYSFSFAKYTPEGAKEMEIEGDSADILANTVNLLNVVAKAYAEETPVTITADKGDYDKAINKVNLRKNVVATTETGTRLLTEELHIRPTDNIMETEVEARVKKDNIDIEGTGAKGDSNLKRIHFKKNVTVIIQDPDPDRKNAEPTTITSKGPLLIDYEANTARFKENVIAEDNRGRVMADVMDVFYDRKTRRVTKIIALGNVVVENPDGNKTFSDNVVYLADEGRIILGGDAEALYYKGEFDMDESDEGFLNVPTGNKVTP